MPNLLILFLVLNQINVINEVKKLETYEINLKNCEKKYKYN